ncbi:Serine--pyruvate aminotransferase, mitochondrial [Lamellibrachia satsuma]|nr:Serine--pyruvate aminotransferase, mitochondrial [Lamellibrachia satsuma]
MATSPAPKALLRPMAFPRKLLLGPGPSSISPRVAAACALPLLGHLHPEFVQIMDEVKEGIQYAFQTNNSLTLAISGTGHAAMEAACCNLIEPGDVVVVAWNGTWGERFSDMAARNGADVRIVKKPAGSVFSPDEIEKAVSEHRPRAVYLTMGESSGGTLQPLQGMGAVCKRHDCLLVVDAVATVGGVPLYMDQWGIDVLYTGSQKVLSCPPGVSPISFSAAAERKIAARRQKPVSFYFDMGWLANYWGCDGQPRRYHHTAPVSGLYALREGLAIIAEEGLEESWRRHRQCADMLHAGLEDMGLSLFEHRLPTVTPVRVPTGVDWKEVAAYVMQHYRVELSGGLGETANKVWRIGLMGHNATPDNVRLLLRALKEAIEHCRTIHSSL